MTGPVSPYGSPVLVSPREAVPPPSRGAVVSPRIDAATSLAEMAAQFAPERQGSLSVPVSPRRENTDSEDDINTEELESELDRLVRLQDLRASGALPLRPPSHRSSTTITPVVHSTSTAAVGGFHTTATRHSFSENVTALALKVWDVVKNYWGLIAIVAAALVATTLFFPFFGLSILTLIGTGIIGFIAGFGLSHIAVIGGDRSYIDKINEMGTTGKVIAGIAMAVLFPLAPIIGGFLLGNDSFHQLHG